MTPLILEASKDTPYIELNNETNIMTFNGKSFPENSFDYYAPIFEWLEEYIIQENLTTIMVNFDITYLNSSSSKVFLIFLNFLKKHRKMVKI